MNENSQYESVEDELDRRMRALQAPDVPEDLLPRCLATIAPANVGQPMTPVGSTSYEQRLELRRLKIRKRVRLLGIIGSAAAVVAFFVVSSLWWPHASLADVAAAVLQQPWIHVSETDSQGATREVWYSPNKDISAWHDKDSIEYRDHRLRIYYAYDLRDKVLYRVPEESRRGMEQFASMIASLRILLQSKPAADAPLEHLGFLGNDQARVEVVKQKVEKVQDDNRQWLDYHLTVKGRDKVAAEPIQSEMLLRVDAQTKLLRLVRVQHEWQGKPVAAEGRFDYPDKGPADVYELGVPKTAKLVDRIPTDDLARILETIRAGRQRMDNYRAIVVSGEKISFSGMSPMIVYRKGDKFRTETPAFFGDLSKVKGPKADEDLGAWWKERTKHMAFSPHYITRGPTEYCIGTRGVTDPDGSERVEVARVEKHVYNVNPGETYYPAYWSRMPEFVCRPPLGIPQQTLEPVLDTSSREGPAGTILLRVRNIERRKPPQVKNSAGELVPQIPDVYRNWLDPTRDYAVVRYDMMSIDESGKETPTHSTIIDEMAKSPQGTWYATQFRTMGAMPDGKMLEEKFYLYLDFNADLPDSLFEPPAVGQRIH